jgi:hypothetical protein
MTENPAAPPSRWSQFRPQWIRLSLIFLFEHDLFSKTGFPFLGSCSDAATDDF